MTVRCFTLNLSKDKFKKLPFLRILQCDQWYSTFSPWTLAGLMERICDDHDKPDRRFKEDSLWF